jgi:hypothetical protein
MSSPADFDVEAAAHQVALAIAGMRQVLAPIDDAALGYRAQLEGQGWSAAAAERMAFQFHQSVMANVLSGANAIAAEPCRTCGCTGHSCAADCDCCPHHRANGGTK